MVHKPIVAIPVVAVAGILIMAILAATVNAQESNNTGNAQQQSNSTENAQQESNATSPNESTETNATTTGVPGNTTTTGMPENATSPSGSLENTTSGMESNNTGNAPESNSNMTAAAPNIGNARQESNNTGNATSPSGSTASNTTNVNTTNAYCDSCNNDIYYGKMDFANMVLAVHNRERAAVGVPPLVWNDTLAAGAKTWAEHLATTGKFEHSSYTDRQGAGENLAAGKEQPSIVHGMQGWIAEKNSYQRLPSATGNNVTGHYTQMVWNTTKEIGCATATSTATDILVCRYSPAGNTGGPPY